MSAGVEIGGQDGKIRGVEVSRPEAEHCGPSEAALHPSGQSSASLNLGFFFLPKLSLFPDIIVPETQGR